MKDWIIYDPYLASEGSQVVVDFDTQAEADAALVKGEVEDPESYGGCYVMPLAQFENDM